VISVEDLSCRYEGKEFELRIERLEVKEGEFVLVTGPSGSGKSTLAYCLSGLIPQCIKNARMLGRVTVCGMDTTKTPVCELSKRVGFVLQNPEAQIFGMTVEEDLAFGLENLGVPYDEMRRRVDETLNLMGMRELRDRDTSSLSGGMKQKLAIASVLIMRPDVLILDEPLANLDPKETNGILSVLYSLKRIGKTVVVVERRLGELSPLVDRVVALKDGRLVADESPRSFFEDEELVKGLNVVPPKVVEVAYELRRRGLKLEPFPLTERELVRSVVGC